MNIQFIKNWKKANHLTHAGKFHADEVFATVILSRVRQNMILARVTDVNWDELGEDVFVYDVGRRDFDHHQQGGNGEREGIKYAACGLVWREFGGEVVQKYLEKNPKMAGVNSFYELPEGAVEELAQRVDRTLIQYIDADDNGMEMFGEGVEPNYKPVVLADIIGSFNPRWNEKLDVDEAFMEAVRVAEKILERVLTNEAAVYAAKSAVEEAIARAEDGIMILDKYMVYEQALFESKNPKADEIKYVIYPSNRGGYNVRTALVKPGSFENRKDLPAEWAGLVDEDLQRVTGVVTAKFCHNTRFLCVAETLEDAVKLAKLAVAA